MTCFNIPGDIALKSDGTGLAFAENAERLRNRIRVGFGTPIGTWVYDQASGFNIQSIWGAKEKDLEYIRATVWEYLEVFPEVRSVDEVTPTLSAGVLTIAFTVTTIDGLQVSDTVS
jgi:hypothetical protein